MQSHVTSLAQVREKKLSERFHQHLDRILNRVMSHFVRDRAERDKLKLLAEALLEPEEYREFSEEIGLNEVPTPPDGNPEKERHLKIVR